jgi:hypothetical protein
MTQINYIIGIGRSGTSLLMSLLGSHPELHAPPENYFSVFFANAFANKTSFAPQEIQLIHRFNNAFGKLQPYVGFEYELPNEVITNGFKGSYLELCNEIYNSFQHAVIPKKENPNIIDKNPVNTLFLSELASINSSAKYILMIRDYRANILSRKESIHLLSPRVAFNAIRWNYFTKRALQWKKRYPKQVLVVRYEDLVYEPDVILQQVFDFLGVSPIFSEELRQLERSGYEHYKNDVAIEQSERARKKYEDLAKPIFTNRTDKWKTGLRESEIEIAEAFCKEIGSIFDYRSQSNLKKSNSCLIRLKYLPLNLKIRTNFIKDALFYYLPISYKVNRFEQYVAKIELKRKNTQ